MVLTGSDDLVWDTHRLRIATEAAGVALWSWNVDTDTIALDERARQMWGVLADHDAITFETLSARIHPSDTDRVRTAFEATRQVLGRYDIDFRILHGNSIRWIAARGQGDDMGIVGRVMFGVFLDVTDRKLEEETRELVAGEMSHRVKNLFAIVAAVVAIAARSATTTTSMAQDLTRRIVALGRAHDLVRPAPGDSIVQAADLDSLLQVLLGPYDTTGTTGDRIRLRAGPGLQVGEGALTTLSLVIHELATNSLKHGALSVPDGRLAVECRLSANEAILVWTEQGGPVPIAPKEPGGFGTRLITQSVSGQLGGSVDRAWLPGGLVITVRMDPARLRG